MERLHRPARALLRPLRDLAAWLILAAIYAGATALAHWLGASLAGL